MEDRGGVDPGNRGGTGRNGGRGNCGQDVLYERIICFQQKHIKK
jgi:ribosomal protein L15